MFGNYLLEIESGINSNPSCFWHYIIISKRKTVGYPLPMSYNDSQGSDLTSVCGLFATFFKSVYSENSMSTSSLVFDNDDNNNHSLGISFTFAEIKDALAGLYTKMSIGPDGCPSLVLNKCSEVLGCHLAYLFNQNLMYGIFPKYLKLGTGT